MHVLQEMYLRGLGTSSSLVSSPEVPATASCPILCVSTNKTLLLILKLAKLSRDLISFHCQNPKIIIDLPRHLVKKKFEGTHGKNPK